MSDLSSRLASAAVLATSALEMLNDAAAELQDAGDHLGLQDLSGITALLASAIEKLVWRKAEIEASEPANENDPSAQG